ncbi:hypothetical protein BVZ80_01823B, partial [Haemophilus influenzae]
INGFSNVAFSLGTE